LATRHQQVTDQSDDDINKRLERIKQSNQAVPSTKSPEFAAIWNSPLIGMAISTISLDVIECNESFANMLQRDPFSIVGTNINAHTHPDDKEDGATAAAAVRQGKQASINQRKRYVAKDGSIVWADLHGELVIDGSLQPRVRWVSTILQVDDATARPSEESKAMERELVELLHKHHNQMQMPAIHISGISGMGDGMTKQNIEASGQASVTNSANNPKWLTAGLMVLVVGLVAVAAFSLGGAFRATDGDREVVIEGPNN
jgi:PAS domain S-box-containing protein